MTEEVKREDNWCFGTEFFIQWALFKKTGCADWKLQLTRGPRDNMTDGEVDYFVVAKRLSACIGGKNVYETKKFRVTGNGYSWKSILKSARSALSE